MVRVSRFVAIVAAIVMTAFTFGQIGRSADAHTNIHPMPIAAYRASEALFDASVVLRCVVSDLYRIVGFGAGSNS
jgi:hypothetical protein